MLTHENLSPADRTSLLMTKEADDLIFEWQLIFFITKIKLFGFATRRGWTENLPKYFSNCVLMQTRSHIIPSFEQ